MITTTIIETLVVYAYYIVNALLQSKHDGAHVVKHCEFLE